tara:strand:- start:3520 stop:3954 length:435 start_codon:yes stop_codon:yes gene_type:complete
MGFFSRLGNKINSLYDRGHRLGMKALGTASRIGHKVSEIGHAGINALKDSPFGVVAATPIALAEKVLGVVDKGTALADKGMKIGKAVDDVVKNTKSALERKPPPPSVDAGLQTHPKGTSGGSLREEPKVSNRTHRDSRDHSGRG